MAKSARSNRKRQLRSQHRLSVHQTDAFKSRERTQQEALQRVAQAGAQQRHDQAGEAMEDETEQPSPAGPTEAEKLEAELLRKMLNPRQRTGKQKRPAVPLASSSKHHKRRKQRGAKNPLLHFNK